MEEEMHEIRLKKRPQQPQNPPSRRKNSFDSLSDEEDIRFVSTPSELETTLVNEARANHNRNIFDRGVDYDSISHSSSISSGDSRNNAKIERLNQLVFYALI